MSGVDFNMEIQEGIASPAFLNKWLKKVILSIMLASIDT